MDKAQIIENLPIEGCQVVGSFEAADSLQERGALSEAGHAGRTPYLHTRPHTGSPEDTHCYVFLLAKETHSNVIPEWRAFWNGTSHNSVFGEGNVEVSMGLHHAAGCQEGLEAEDVEDWSELSPNGRGSKEPC